MERNLKMSITPDVKPNRRISKKQMQANSRNGKRGGPKTSAGKKRVSRNATKHGLLASEAVIMSGDGQESANEYAGFVQRLMSDLQPVGVLEEILVEKIAVSCWRLKRSLRAEVGGIRRNLDSVKFYSEQTREQDLLENRNSLFGCDYKALRKSSGGINCLLDSIEKAIDCVDVDCDVSDHVIDELKKNFGKGKDSITYRCRLMKAIAESAPSMDDNSIRKYKRKLPMNVLKDEQRVLKELNSNVKLKEALDCESRTLSHNLPSKEDVEKLMRYETTIERQLYRAISHLEHLQKRRNGTIRHIDSVMEIGAASSTIRRN